MGTVIGKCGVDCGNCQAFRPNAETAEARQRTGDAWAKYFGVRLKPEHILCNGCQAKDPWASGNVLPDRWCEIRPCAVKTGVENCAHCSAYPCGAGHPDMDRKATEEKMGKPIPEEEYLAYFKPYERHKNLDRLRASLKPEEIVPKLEVKPLRVRIAPLPEDLQLSKGQLAGLKAVHSLLTRIMSVEADTLAMQQLRKRSRKHVLGLLWLVALYGDLREADGARVVLESSARGPKREWCWLVRKRDNRLHSAMYRASKILGDYGVAVEFTPLEKAWQITLSFEESAGGDEALNGLKRWVEALAKEHGEPVYAGASKLAGEAFELFKRGDVRS